MTAKVSITDMRWLRDRLPDLDGVDPQTVERITDWLDQCVSVRIAQRTKSKTAAHNDLMTAYWAAAERWAASCEQETSMYETEVAEYRERHPMPTLKDFMRAARRVDVNVCPLCGSPLDTEEEVAS